MAIPSSPIYAIPGLGTDLRIFSHFQQVEFRGLEWIDPNPSESLGAYARRLAQDIHHSEPILVGVSFGGVVAQEIASFLPVKRIILISSIQSDTELPAHFRFMRKVPLYHLSRGNWRVKTLPLWGRLFGIHDKAEQALLMDMFSKQSDSYRMWAIGQLLAWKPQPISCQVVHVHGTHDRVFPIQHIGSCIPIQGGDHFMVYRKAQEVEGVLTEWLV